MSRSLIERVWGSGGVRLLLGDAAVLVVLVAIVVSLLSPPGAGGGAERAEVEVAGRPVASIDLALDGVSEVVGPLGITRLEVRGGRLRVLSSPCPRQACRHGGWIGEAGRLLVCLPNEVVVRLPGRLPGAPDALSR